MTDLVALAPILDPWLIFLSKACSETGVSCRLITLDPAERASDDDERDCLKWAKQNQEFSVEVLTSSEITSLEGSVLFAGLRGNRENATVINKVSSNFSRSIGLLRFASSSRRYQVRQIFKEAYNPFYADFTELWTEDSDINLLSLALRKPHRYFGALPHQRCSIINAHWMQLEAPIPQGRRERLFSWAGSLNPKRESITNWIESRLNVNREKFTIGNQTHQIVWHSDLPGSERSRNFANYLKEIESAWFCLCLPGFTGTTHRSLECILRGSIPVIPAELVRYTRLPLVDKINSVFVYNNNWTRALQEISSSTLHERLFMQKEVVRLAKTNASLGRISQRLVQEVLVG